MNSLEDMGSGATKSLQEKEEQRDRLQDEIKMMAENNLNMKHELEYLRNKLEKHVGASMRLINRLNLSGNEIIDIVTNLSCILKSYSSQLELNIADLEEECNQDWKIMVSDDNQTIEQFLDTFIEHRKEYYKHKQTRDRLVRELNTLCMLR